VAAHRKRDPYVPRRTGRARFPELVTLGGSSTDVDGLASKSADRWPARVGRQLGIAVLDLGRAGTTLRDAYERGAVQRALTSGAAFVTIGFAVDDCLRLGLPEFTGLIDQILYECETSRPTPLLLTGVWLPYPAHLTVEHWEETIAPYNHAVRRAARSRGARLVDIAERVDKLTANGALSHVRDGASDRHRVVTGSRMTAHLVIQSLRAEGARATPQVPPRRSLVPLRRVSA
jgi:hypothetical protein